MKEIVGFEEYVRVCNDIVKNLEGPELTRAVKKGGKIVQQAIKKEAPVDTSALRDGLILVKEKKKTEAKVVYQVTPDPKMNAVFQKPVKNPIRTTAKHAYYPASQEYGYFTRRPGGGMLYVRVLPCGASYAVRSGGVKDYNWQRGSKAIMNKVPGKHYMRTGADVASEAAKNAIAKSLLDDIAKRYGG